MPYASLDGRKKTIGLFMPLRPELWLFRAWLEAGFGSGGVFCHQRPEQVCTSCYLVREIAT